MYKEFEIYWDDLTEECHERLRKFLKLEKDDNNNWDIFPITSIGFEIEEPKVEDTIQ